MQLHGAARAAEVPASPRAAGDARGWRHARTKWRSNSIVAWSWTVTNPPMFGAVMPKSENGNVMDPAASIAPAVQRAWIGIVTDFVTPWIVRSPVAENAIADPLVAFAGSAIGAVSLNVACG